MTSEDISKGKHSLSPEKKYKGLALLGTTLLRMNGCKCGLQMIYSISQDLGDESYYCTRQWLDKLKKKSASIRRKIYSGKKLCSPAQ